MLFTELNEDILSVLLTHLDVTSAVVLLSTCRSLYESLWLWRCALLARKAAGPLCCPQGTDLLSLDIKELRRIARKTACLWRNWNRPEPQFRSFKTFQLRSTEELLCTIPSSDIALTVTFHGVQVDSPRFVLRCVDLRNGRELGRLPVWSSWLTQYAGNQIYDGVLHQFTMAFVTRTVHSDNYHSQRSETHLHIVKVDYSNRDCVIMDGTHRLTLHQYEQMRPSSEFRLHIKRDSITMVVLSGDNTAVSYAIVEPSSCQPLDVVRFRSVPLAFSALPSEEDPPYLLEFFTQEDRIHVIMRDRGPPTTLYSCSFRVDDGPSVPSLQLAVARILSFPAWMSNSIATLGDIFDVYDVSDAHQLSSPVLLLVLVPEIIFCPMRVADGLFVPKVIPGDHLILQSDTEDQSILANTVAFTTHAGLSTLNRSGSRLLGKLQLLVYHPASSTWSVHNLTLPPEVDLDEFLADESTYDLDQHQGTVILWGRTGKVYVVSYLCPECRDLT